jgi:hypothetical protein
MTESIFLNRWRRNRFYHTSSLPVCMRAYLCIGSRNLSTLFALFAPVPFTRDLSQTFAIEFSCFTTCLVSQCSAWKRDISSCSHRVLSLVFGTIQHI